MATRLHAILTDRATPRLDFVCINAFTINLYALAYTNRRAEYIIIAAISFSSNERRIRNSEAEFRNSAFYSRPWNIALNNKMLLLLHPLGDFSSVRHS